MKIGFFLVILFFLLGCQPRVQEPELVLLTPGGTIRKAVDAVVAEFRQDHPEIRVRVITSPGKDYYVKSLTMLAGRAHVDLLWMGQGFGMFASRGALLDLTPYLEREPDFARDFNPTVLDWYRLDGALYGLPYGVDLLAVAYNQDLFDAAGVSYPHQEWTLPEMLDRAAQLNRIDAQSGRTEVAGLGMIDLDFRFYGLSLLTSDHQAFALNNATGLEWLRENLRLIHDERILQRGSDLASIDRLTGFLNGQVAMIAVATWDIGELRDRALFRWDIVPYPRGTTGEQLTWASSCGFSIARNSRQPEAAWALLKRLCGEDFQRQMLEQTVPTLSPLLPAYLQAHPAPPQGINAFLTSLGGLQPSPRIAAIQEVEAEWQYWQELALYRKISVEHALAEAEKSINAILELHRKEEGERP